MWPVFLFIGAVGGGPILLVEQQLGQAAQGEIADRGRRVVEQLPPVKSRIFANSPVASIVGIH